MQNISFIFINYYAIKKLKTMKQKALLLAYFISITLIGKAQSTFPDNGVKDQRSDYYLFKNATLHVDARTVLADGWVLIKGTRIEKVGKDFEYPSSAMVFDLKGKHIYPSFIDIYSDYGMPEISRQRSGGFYETQFNSKKEGPYAWNQAIKPEQDAASVFKVNTKQAEELRKQGFGAVISHQKDGIVRGASALVALGDGAEHQNLLKTKVSSHYSFEKGSSTQSYPVSLMGSVALLRQTFYDAQWYNKNPKKSEFNLSLDEFTKNLSLPSVFHGKSVLDAMRAHKIGKEFGIQYILKSGGDDYQKLDEIKALQAHLVVPVNFPKAIDVEDPMDAERVSLTELKHWEMAASNLANLATHQVPFSITASDNADKSTFLVQVRKAILYGLDPVIAFEALTSNPAKLLKLDNQLGAIKNGLLANFMITSSEIFNEKNSILENWVLGKKYTVNEPPLSEISGNYNIFLQGFTNLKMEVSGEPNKPSIEIVENDSTKIKTTVSRENNFVTINFKKDPKSAGWFRLSGVIEKDTWSGEGKDNLGNAWVWRAEKLKTETEPSKKDSLQKPNTPEVGDVLFPFAAFGNSKKASQEDFIVKNATLWTNESEGKMIGDVYVKNGKIEQVGKNIEVAGVKIIDGTRKHLTTGIIDEHSHIALFSINEIETVSSEVRQEDALDPDDIDIYRQLAGGVTTSQLLHGSADCIGGQSAIIKLKWGETSEKLLIDNSPKFIKFALGENVKRGNAAQRPNRFPSTRMGVEQVFQDAFTRAIAYKKEWADYNNMKVKTGLSAPRKDLELDALVEILEGKRHISCHSYVQSEINMLMNLADSLGFKINTLTHILEGYKVADKMKARNINASTFSDWWAYKMEVKEAIPYNAAIMTQVGVNTAINSDDAEMARRLNQEAAKTMLYGGLSEEQAWKLVTLNPARMLHLDNRLGSLKKGKDADLVLWSENPLSIYAKPEKTIIDGVVYFDEAKMLESVKSTEVEKNRIIQKLLAEKSKGLPTTKPATKAKPNHIHCDSMLEFGGISIEQFEEGQGLRQSVNN
jgi:imidazolonepropionase-like amidohydrolase